MSTGAGVIRSCLGQLVKSGVFVRGRRGRGGGLVRLFGGGKFAASAGVDSFGLGFFPDLLLKSLFFFLLGLLLFLEGG